MEIGTEMQRDRQIIRVEAMPGELSIYPMRVLQQFRYLHINLAVSTDTS